MSPRTGRPTNDHKDKGYRLRISESDIQKLDFCVEALSMTKAEVIRNGIDKMYCMAMDQNNKME